MKDNKTNVMRILDKCRADYEPHFYESDGQVDGVHVAETLGIPFERCFKTLVTFYKSSNGKTDHFVLLIACWDVNIFKVEFNNIFYTFFYLNSIFYYFFFTHIN